MQLLHWFQGAAYSSKGLVYLEGECGLWSSHPGYVKIIASNAGGQMSTANWVLWLFPPWQWTEGLQLQIHLSIHPQMDKSVWNRNNGALKRQKKRSKGYKDTEGCPGQAWSSEAPGYLCWGQGKGGGAAENRASLLHLRWPDIFVLYCCPCRLQEACQEGPGWSCLSELLMFVQEKFWGTWRSSVLLTLGIPWLLRRWKVLQSFVCRQVCLFSWKCLAMDIIYSSYKSGTWTSFLQYQSTSRHSCESYIYGKFYFFLVPSANCTHFFYLHIEICNILHPKTFYFWGFGCVLQAYNMFCLFTSRRTHNVITTALSPKDYNIT